MTKLKQISAKIDAVTLEKIDDLAGKRYYLTRNMIINQILTAVMDGADMDSIRRMMDYDRESKKELQVTCQCDEDT